MDTTALEALTNFTNREGHSRVPLSHIERLTSEHSVALGKIVRDLRGAYRKNEVDEATIKAVEALGFQWSPRGPRSDARRNSEMIAMRKQGTSLTKIAEHFNVTRQRVHQIVGKVS